MIRRIQAKTKRLLSRMFIGVFFYAPRPSKTVHGLKLILDPRRRWIDWNLVTRGSYEAGTLSLMDRLIRRGGTFVDVGANIGLMSTYAAKKVGSEGRVFAFEPDDINFSSLVFARKANKLPWLLPLPLALAAKPGVAMLWRSPIGDGGLSSLSRIEGFDPAGSITVTTLDLFFQSVESGPVDLVKVDVEGFEKEVVLGGLQFLNQHKPTVIIEMISNGAVEAGHILADHGFIAFVSEGKSVAGARNLTKTFPRILESDNMIFVHSEKSDSLLSLGFTLLE